MSDSSPQKASDEEDAYDSRVQSWWSKLQAAWDWCWSKLRVAWDWWLKLQVAWDWCRSKLRVAWDETGSFLQYTWIALWAVGLIFLGLGCWGDAADFWKNKSYLVNLFSALTGAAFGIPLALVFLQRVAAAETDAAEARAAHLMATRVSSYLAASAVALVKGETSADDAISKIRAAKTYVKDQRSTIPQVPFYSSLNVFHGTFQFHRNLYIDALQNVRTHVDKLWNPRITELLAEVSVQWSILRTISRPKLLESDGKWLAGMQEEELSRLVRAVTEASPEDWQREGTSLLSSFRYMPNATGQNVAFVFKRMTEVENRFDAWFEQILGFIDAAADLITKSAAAEQFWRNLNSHKRPRNRR